MAKSIIELLNKVAVNIPSNVSKYITALKIREVFNEILYFLGTPEGVIQKYTSESLLPTIGDSKVVYFLNVSGSKYLKYWNGIEYINASTRTDYPKAISFYLRDYYAKYSDIDTSKYNGSTRDILVVEDENNSSQATSYLFNGSILTTIPKSILDRIEALEYVPQSITSFTNNVNNVEKGTTVTSITFSFGFNKTPTSASINNGIGSVSGSLKTATVSLTTSTTYTLTASDGTTTVTSNTSVNVLNKAYWGSSANTTLNNSQVLGLVSNTLTSTRNRTINVDGNGEYIYYCYPASFGDANFTIGGFGVTLIKTTLTVTNALGDATLYNIYRTSDIQFGTAIQIQIT